MISQRLIRAYAARDVDRVRQHARIVITMRDGHRPCISEHPQGTLEVAAVIGPSTGPFVRVPEAVLCEVGLHRTRPYQTSIRLSASRHGRRKHLSSVPARRQDFMLTSQQYRTVAPILFSMLFAWMRERVDAWREPRFWLKTDRLYANQKNRLVTGVRARSYPRGCRVSVSPRDTFLCADLLRREYDDPFWEQQLAGLASTIIYAFRPLERGYEVPFGACQEVQYIREYLQSRLTTSLPRYVLADLPQYLRGQRGVWDTKVGPPRNYRLIDEVEGLVAEVIGREPLWQRTMMGYALPGSEGRTKALSSVRDISSLRSGKKVPGYYHVFELLPEPRKERR